MPALLDTTRTVVEDSISHGNYSPALIIKSTRRCNLRCTYCTDYRVTEQEVFDIELMAELLTKLSDDPAISSVHFIWHGGEPLIKGQSFYRKLAFLQQRLLAEKDKKFTNSVQTNGVMASEKWGRFFRDFGYNVGVSLDGPAEIQNRKRPMAVKGRGSFDAATKGLRVLQDHDVKAGVLTVVSQEVLDIGAQEMYQFFKESGLPKICLLWMRGDFSSKEESLRYNRDYGDFMVEIMNLCLSDDDPSFQIREIESKLDRLFGLPQRLCKDGGACVGKYYGLENDGTVWHCDKFLGDERFKVGNIRDARISELAGSDRMKSIARFEAETRNGCEPCKWFDLCQGGCLSDLLILHKDEGEIGTDDCWHFKLYESMSEMLANSPTVLEAALEYQRQLEAPEQTLCELG